MRVNKTLRVLAAGILAIHSPLWLLSCTSPESLAQSQRRPEDPRAAAELERLAGVVNAGSEIFLLSFAEPCFQCREKDVRLEDVLRSSSKTRLSASDTAYLKETLTNPASFFTGASKPCGPFIAEAGLLFRSSRRESVLLISPSCQTARLVPQEGAQPYFLNLDRIYHDLWNRLKTAERER